MSDLDESLEIPLNLKPSSISREAESIYDFAWYPKMSYYDPGTFCFVSSSKDSPLHLWNGETGKVSCTYSPINRLDEIHSPHSLTFSPDGSQLLTGFHSLLTVFPTQIPGRSGINIPTCSSKSSSKDGLSGLISHLSYSSCNPTTFASTTFEGKLGIWDDRTWSLTSTLNTHKSGLTQVSFSSDGFSLWTNWRSCDDIHFWDLRNLSHGPIQILTRNSNSRMRMKVTESWDSTYITSGGIDGEVSIWNRDTGAMAGTWQAHRGRVES